MIKKTKTRIPGKMLLKHIQYGHPKFNGIYFVYYKPKDTRAMSSTFPIANYEIVNINKGKNIKNLNILAYIGPLPILTLDELENGFKDEELSLHVYCIGTLKGASKSNWKEGPFHEDILAILQSGEKGDYVFEINQRTTLPKPISKFSTKYDKFINIKKPNITIKKLKKLMKQAKNKPYIEKFEIGEYIVATMKGIKTQKYKERTFDIIKAMGVVPKKKNTYIFEIREQGIIPIHGWNHGWNNLSDQKVRDIRHIIGDI